MSDDSRNWRRFDATARDDESDRTVSDSSAPTDPGDSGTLGNAPAPRHEATEPADTDVGVNGIDRTRTEMTEMDGVERRDPVSEPPADGPPTRLGAWLIEDQLGEGGMGVVFRGRHESSHEVVAIKTIRADRLRTRPDLRDQFIREAKHTASLRHDRILAVREVVDGHLPYYVMPFIEGGSLRDLARAGEPLPPERLLPIMLDVVSALEHAHREGKVHRDIKPANILIDRRGRAFVSDFGLVTSMVGDDASDSDRKHNFGSGTMPYMAPELFQGEAGDYRVDVYAVGAMMYELLGGEAPYAGDRKTLPARIQSGPPRAIRELNPRVPRGWATIVDGAMARDLHGRYASIRDLRADLERLRDGDAPLGPSRGKSRGRGAWLVGGVVAAIVGLSAIGAIATAAFLLIDWSPVVGPVGPPIDGPTGPGGGEGGDEPPPDQNPEPPQHDPKPEPPPPPPPTPPSPPVTSLAEALAKCTDREGECVEGVRVAAASLRDPSSDADRRALKAAIRKVVDDDRGDLVTALRASLKVRPLSWTSDGDVTLLHIAARDGRAEVAAALLAAVPDGSDPLDPNARNVRGETPLFLAVENGHANVVKALLEAKADVTIRGGTDATGDTVLHRVCGRDSLDDEDLEIVTILVESRPVHERDVFVNLKGRDGDTALHRLARRSGADRNVLSMFRLLLGHGGDPTIRNAEGDTVIEVIDDRVVDKEERTRLLEACENGGGA